MYRVALVASHVIQYQAPFFRLLSAQSDIDLHVLFCSRAGADTYLDVEMGTALRWDVDLLGGYDHTFLTNHGGGEGYGRLTNPGIVPAILYGRYDCVIFFLGWGTITSLLGIAACRMTGTPFLLYGDSSFPPPPSFPRDAFLRALFGLTDAFLVSGVLNADYYRAYGAEPSRFFLVPWAVDNERFSRSAEMTAEERKALRATFGAADDDLVIVYSAKLLPRKDPMTLFRAVDMMTRRERTVVVLLGDGELREPLEQFVRTRGLRVHFAGFVNQAQLPKHYASGDVFVLPSVYEPRGAVINEAMACGLPVVVTDRCGSLGDIVLEGENAFVYPAGDAATLARQLDTLGADPALRERMSRRSREIIATWDYQRGVEGVREALRATC